MVNDRPDPDDLLRRMKADEARAKRGKNCADHSLAN
jgi:hypothetical protein